MANPIGSDHPVPVSATDWQDLFSKQERSGLSARAFCAHHGIPYPRLLYWRRQLRPMTRDRSSLPSVRRESSPATEVPQPAFIEVPVAPRSKTSPGWELELQLGSGLTLRLRSV